jgi:hypothetical protein
MSDHSKSDRRQFLKTVGLAGLTTALAAPALARAQAPVPTAPPAAVPAPPDTARAAAPEIAEDARALAGIIERRYGRHLSREQLASIARDFDGDLKALERMRQVKLANADEPDFTFYVKGAER